MQGLCRVSRDQRSEESDHNCFIRYLAVSAIYPQRALFTHTHLWNMPYDIKKLATWW